ncbi:hypothetical protein ABPG77_006085 [Micractinium sp. CCAP 211/92]
MAAAPRKRAAWAALLLIVLLVGPGTAAGAYNPRVRKELRSLSEQEYKALIIGLSTMLTISTEAGRRLFGPKYISYQECIVKHSVATNDPRGDQMEQSLLLVSPTLKALPYWDITLDNPGTGKYFGTPKTIFSPKYLGQNDGDPRVGSGVTSGVFAWRQVQRFIPAQWPQYTKVYNGSKLGFTRGPTNINANPLVTRFPTQNLVDALKKADKPDGTTSLPFGKMPKVAFDMDYLVTQNGQLLLRYPEANYKRCLDPKTYRTWMEWNFCLDVTVLNTAPDSVDKSRYLGPQAGTTALLHAAPHWTTGGPTWPPADVDSAPPAARRAAIGDMFDVSTSPNEPLLFPLHHANLDRSAMMWQAAATKLDPSMPSKYWHYPASKAQYSTANNGTLLNDILCSNAPFKTIFLSPPANPLGYTHKEVLYYTRPGASPYIYDSML